jgi:hypothetical protein
LLVDLITLEERRVLDLDAEILELSLELVGQVLDNVGGGLRLFRHGFFSKLAVAIVFSDALLAEKSASGTFEGT